MVATRLSFPVESSEKTCTMLRSAGLSASSKTYLPGIRTRPGISTGALNWNSVLLFHSSANTGLVIKKPTANKPLRHTAFNLLFIFAFSFIFQSSAFQQTLRQLDTRTVYLDFKGVCFE